MLEISKDVAHKLHNEYGIRWKDNGISKSATKHPKFYLTESEWNLRNLLKVEKNEKAVQLLKDIKERKEKEKKENTY